MKKIVFILFLLSACGMDSYRPNVAQPQDAKYEADLKECIAYSKDTRSKFDPRSVVIGATGLAGYAVLNEARPADDKYFKNGYELTDECLISKGYTIRP